MIRDINKISAEALLALGGTIIFLVAGAYLGLSALVEAQQGEVLPPHLEGKSYFEIGQYYFNHDDDPEGPYDIKKAEYYYTQAIAQNPYAHSLAWYQLGRIDFINGRFDAALEKFNTQIEYFGDSVPNVYYAIGLTYGYRARAEGMKRDWEQAEEAFMQFIDFAPHAPWPRVDLAWIYFSQGKFEAMLPVLEAGLAYEPENAWLLNMYGLALLNTGAKQEALQQFQKAQAQAALLTVAQWGKAYPGNNPDAWAQGLAEFRSVIEKNKALAQQ